jgi:hypothetical protein
MTQVVWFFSFKATKSWFDKYNNFQIDFNAMLMTYFSENPVVTLMDNLIGQLLFKKNYNFI